MYFCSVLYSLVLFCINREKICCGEVFKGPNGELLLDPRLLKPCTARLQICKLQTAESKVSADGNETTISKGFSDSSSDSGYDESSNQGVNVDNAFKKEVQVSISQLETEVPTVN